MRVVDTSAWIEWLQDTPTGARIAKLFPPRHEWLVPTIVQLELTKWAMREIGEVRTDRVVAFTMKCRVIDLDTELALAAAEISSSSQKLATADAIIYATSKAFGADVLTCDDFEGLPNVIFIAKQDG